MSRYDGKDGQDLFYPRHKDNYLMDSNHEENGQELRKFTMILFLNDNVEVDDAMEADPQKYGALRLFNRNGTVDVDIAPRIGRAVLFKS